MLWGTQRKRWARERIGIQLKHILASTTGRNTGPWVRTHSLYDIGKILTCSALGVTLWKRYREAVKDRNRQEEAHRGFTASLEHDQQLEDWEAICARWEGEGHPREDPSVINPFAIEEECKFLIKGTT